jgi:hypothetical protein
MPKVSTSYPYHHAEFYPVVREGFRCVAVFPDCPRVLGA